PCGRALPRYGRKITPGSGARWIDSGTHPVRRGFASLCSAIAFAAQSGLWSAAGVRWDDAHRADHAYAPGDPPATVSAAARDRSVFPSPLPGAGHESSQRVWTAGAAARAVDGPAGTLAPPCERAPLPLPPAAFESPSAGLGGV